MAIRRELKGLTRVSVWVEKGRGTVRIARYEVLKFKTKPLPCSGLLL